MKLETTFTDLKGGFKRHRLPVITNSYFKTTFELKCTLKQIHQDTLMEDTRTSLETCENKTLCQKLH